MSQVVVPDSAAFDVIGTTGGKRLRAALIQTASRGGEVRCAAVTLAEVCRGDAHTRNVEAALKWRFGGQRIRQTKSASDRLADAHVIAICADVDNAVVITSDPNDIHELSSAIPGTRVVVRRPSLDGRG